MASMVSKSLLGLTEQIVDNRGRTCPTADEGLTLIATNCIKQGYRYPVFENVRFVDDSTYATWFRRHPKPGDLIFVTKGSPGRVAMVPDPVTFCIAQDMVALRAKREVIDNRYLYYRLLCSDVRDGIEGLHVGTMIPHFKKGDFDKLHITIHQDLHEQRAIADVLSALDDKIAANDRMTRAVDGFLESCFEQLCPSDHIGLNEIATVNRLVTTPKSDGELRYLDISMVGAGRYRLPPLTSWSDAPGRARRVVNNGDTVWSTVRPNRRSHALILDDDATLVGSTGLAVLSPNAGRAAGLYEATRRPAFVEHLLTVAEGSAYPAVRAEHFGKAPVPGLTSTQWDAFEDVAWPLRLLCHQANVESRNLARTRDELLPLLMSGRLTVKDAAGRASDLP